MEFSKTALSLFLFFILYSSSYATSRFKLLQRFASTTKFSSNQAAEYEYAVDDFVPGETVEKKFSFFGDSSDAPSVHVGYYTLPGSKSARMRYFFFESRNSDKDAPVVISLTGGPGCATEIALFYVNGAFKINNDSSLSWNPYGWDKVSIIIFVDLGGFNYSSDENGIPTDEIGVSNDLYAFLQNDLYITGESRYIQALASRILDGNKNKEGNTINLKGIAIGNGLTNPRIQYQSLTQFAVDNKLITNEDQANINKLVSSCMDAIKTCENEGGDSCKTASYQCEQIISNILSIAGNINSYDIRKTCKGPLCYDFSNMETFLNNKTTNDALGVGSIEFDSCSNAVPNALNQNSMRNNEVYIPQLLEDRIKVLMYAGEYDLICNWLGISNWVQSMKWSGQNQFTASKTTPFFVDGRQAGLLKSHGPLSFLKVSGAGHFVLMDQPKVALKMLVNWMHWT